jgi:RNA polymerase subunit RPABC4/transcription elongation factor Spt4
VATLIACETCGKEIAAEAKTCPHCGARNKRSGWIVNLFLGLVIVILVLFIGLVYKNRVSPFPDCTSRPAARDFKSTFDGSQYARTLNLSAIDVVGQRTVSDDTTSRRRVCQATLMLNNAQNLTYRFTFTLRTNGGYYVDGRPARR